MATTTMGCHPTCRGSNTRPSWLQATLSDLEQRFQSLSLHHAEHQPDSFADRAENYYQKRPQLLSLLQDLYNRYVSLADRYVQAILKPQSARHSRSQSQISLVPSDLDDVETVRTDVTADPDNSDAESSLSFQTPTVAVDKKGRASAWSTADAVISELVSKTVENELLRHEVEMLEKQSGESSRKMRLQRSLLEVLESERMVLLSENARLGYQATAMADENEGLVAEVGFMRQKAEVLARCVVKLREDHRACMLGRKIEALQTQIYGLEKRNRECYEVMSRREEEKTDLVRGVHLELERVKAENRRLREAAAAARKVAKGKETSWGRRMVRKVEEWVVCGSSHVGSYEKEDTITGCGGMKL